MAGDPPSAATTSGSAARSSGSRPPGLVAGLLTGLLLCSLASGLVYAAAELGQLPHYHDSNAYFELARILRVDAHRGIAYPAFLRILDALTGPPSMLAVIENEHPGAPCTAPADIIWLQILQLVVCAAALAYWLRTSRATLGERADRLTRLSMAPLLAVAALVLLDPVVSHFAMSAMPDALAMAASLVFCGALARILLGTNAPGRTGVLLFAGFTAASMLRPEKRWVLLCVLLACALLWVFARRLSAASLARFAYAGLFLALGLSATIMTEQLAFRDYGRPGQGTIILHARVIFPHLGEIFEDLPPDVRTRFTPRDVRLYDDDLLFPGFVMEHVTRGNTQDAAELTAIMARTALRSRGGAIAFDTLKDGIENTLPTPGFYTRLLAIHRYEDDDYRQFSRSDMTPWTHRRMTEHHPRLAHASLAISGAALALLALTAMWRAGTAVRSGTRSIPIEAVLPWAPSVFFALANAAAFALHADQINPRYTLTAHAMLLALLYTGALRFLWPRS